MSHESRRLRFAKFIECYHNSFTGPVGGVFSHSPGFVERVVEGAEPAQAADTLRLDPRLTSTDQGAVAFAVAKAVSEDAILAPSFIDIELAEDTLVVSFTEHADVEKAKGKLGEVGRVGVLASPGDRISDSVVSDMYMLVVEAKAEMAESVVTEMKKKMPPFLRKGAKAKGDEKCGDDEKGGDKSSDENDGARESAPVSCAAYKLAEAVFDDLPLEGCAATYEGVSAAFVSLFGAKALQMAVAATVSESANRNRLIRIMAGRGYLPVTGDPVVVGLGESLDKIVAEKAKVTGLSESPEAYDAALDELAVALDEAIEAPAAIFKLYVERVLDLGLAKADHAALVARLEAAASKNEGLVIARCLRALSNAALFERGVFRDAAVRDAVAAVAAYVAEATKPAPAPADPLDAVLGELLSADA